MSQATGTSELMAALAAPFDPDDVKFKPAVISGNRALALAYIDARAVMDRLDEVLGAENWQDEYEFLPDGSCLCRLRVRIDGEWILKMDVGGESEQPDEGDRRKSAVSDALKRAAVKFGIGRYLYRLPQQWVDYDPQKRQIKSKPVLPAAAQRKPAGRQATAPIPARRPGPGDGPVSEERLEEISAVAAMKGQSEQQLASAIQRKFGLKDLRAMTAMQATALLDALESMPDLVTE